MTATSTSSRTNRDRLRSARFRDWSNAIVSINPTPEGIQQVSTAVGEFTEYLGTLFAERQSEPNLYQRQAYGAEAALSRRLFVRDFIGIGVSPLAPDI